MRIFACSDIHVDYEENLRFFNSVSKSDFQKDILILAGDVTDNITLLQKVLEHLRACFFQLLYVPGNHDLWVRYDTGLNSLMKWQRIRTIAENIGIIVEPFNYDSLLIVPLLGWYDYSFGLPSSRMLDIWMDYYACKWPEGFNESSITSYFTDKNEPHIGLNNDFVISFSHFVPRIDLLPVNMPHYKQYLYPVLGSSLIERQIRQLGSDIHIYGHSHINDRFRKDGTVYINNAFGYPYEAHIASKELECILEI